MVHRPFLLRHRSNASSPLYQGLLLLRHRWLRYLSRCETNGCIDGCVVIISGCRTIADLTEVREGLFAVCDGDAPPFPSRKDASAMEKHERGISAIPALHSPALKSCWCHQSRSSYRNYWNTTCFHCFCQKIPDYLNEQQCNHDLMHGVAEPTNFVYGLDP